MLQEIGTGKTPYVGQRDTRELSLRPLLLPFHRQRLPSHFHIERNAIRALVLIPQLWRLLSSMALESVSGVFSTYSRSTR